ncbi:hypothetical protein BGZ76_004240 [Entomortierella beljakovae]|nr:hypothetical protein BGZ76_004240 [Entomortierella beljakovae]
MAGLESTECRKYYINTSPETIQSLESVTAAMDIAEKPSNKENISDTPSSDDSIGLDHWNRTREKWTQGRWHVVPSANSNNPALNAIHPGNHDAIYDSLVYDHKRLSKPIPLPLVIKVLVSGWKRDGFWPETSVPGFTPSSVPTVNAYVPGFSSTNSQPVTRKS